MNTEEIRRNAYDHITTLGKSKPPLVLLMGNLGGCQEQGRVYGCEATRRSDNPYPLGTAEREWFDAGWIEEQEELCGDGNADLA